MASTFERSKFLDTIFGKPVSTQERMQREKERAYAQAYDDVREEIARDQNIIPKEDKAARNKEFMSLLKKKYPGMSNSQIAMRPYDQELHRSMRVEFTEPGSKIDPYRPEDARMSDDMSMQSYYQNADAYRDGSPGQIAVDKIIQNRPKGGYPSYENTRADLVAQQQAEAKAAKLAADSKRAAFVLQNKETTDAFNASRGNTPPTYVLTANAPEMEGLESIETKYNGDINPYDGKAPDTSFIKPANGYVPANEDALKHLRDPSGANSITNEMWNPSVEQAKKYEANAALYNNANVRNSNVYNNPYKGKDAYLAQRYDMAQNKLGIQSAKGHDMVQDVNRMREITGVAGSARNRIPDAFYGMTPEQAQNVTELYGHPSSDNPYKFDYVNGKSKWEIDEARRMGITRGANTNAPVVQPRMGSATSQNFGANYEPIPTGNLDKNKDWTRRGMSWEGPAKQAPAPAPAPRKAIKPPSPEAQKYYDSLGPFNDDNNRV